MKFECCKRGHVVPILVKENRFAIRQEAGLFSIWNFSFKCWSVSILKWQGRIQTLQKAHTNCHPCHFLCTKLAFVSSFLRVKKKEILATNWRKRERKIIFNFSSYRWVFGMNRSYENFVQRLWKFSKANFPWTFVSAQMIQACWKIYWHIGYEY